jgi:hypothetical protein
MIDYQLDKSTIPEGKTISSRSYFPAAMALVEIGGPNVRDAILQRLGTEDGEKVTRLCVWTLLKTYGEDVTTFLLDRVEAGTKDEAIKQRMKKAKELFAQGDRLLLFDEKPQGTDKETTPAPPAEGESAPAGENYSTPPTSEETPLARDGSAPSSPPIVSSRPTGTSDAAPNATDTGTSSQGGAEGPVAEAAPFPWTIAIVAAVAALAVGAITSLLLTRRKKA